MPDKGGGGGAAGTVGRGGTSTTVAAPPPLAGSAAEAALAAQFPVGSFTRAQAAAIDSYAAGLDFEIYNSAFNNAPNEAAALAQLAKFKERSGTTMADHARALDSAMKPIDADVTVERTIMLESGGAASKFKSKNPDDYKGAELGYGGYSSTTTIKGGLRDWNDGSTGRVAHLVIKAPKGTKGTWVDSGLKQHEPNTPQAQKELLLARNTKLKITGGSIRRDARGRDIGFNFEAEVIQQ